MNKKTKAILSETFAGVLENLVFMFAESVEMDEVEISPSGMTGVRIDYSGPVSGTLEMFAPAGFAKSLAANMLGVEEADEEAEEKSKDALKETLNTICGQLLTSLAGEEPVFSLSTPSVQIIKSGEWALKKLTHEFLCFNVEGHSVLISIREKERAA